MKNIYLIVGPSGSGKTTITTILEDLQDYKSIQSYTTRPPRHENEQGHIFVSESDIPPKEEMVAYTYFNGNHYWATQEQADTHDLYVVDPAGVKFFRENYKGNKRPVVFFLNTDSDTLVRRMFTRGDTEDQVNQRIANDKVMFADFFNNSTLYDYKIDCGLRLLDIYSLIMSLIKKEEDLS